MAGPTPPTNIPAAPSPLVRPRLAYLHDAKMWNLSAEEFWIFLADVPKAILMRCPAKHLSSDAEFYYYEDYRMNKEWAFARKPEDNFFTKRSVYSRDPGDPTWQEWTPDATLATPT
jgi:hypothetical protein